MNARAALAKLLVRVRRIVDKRWQTKLRRTLQAIVAEDAVSKTGPGLHVISVGQGVDPRKLTDVGLFLDETTIDRYYQERSHLIGAINPCWGSRFSQGVALHIANKCGAGLATANGIDRDSAARAWFFAIWTEVCTFVPARHLARWLAARAKGDLIVIPLASLTVRYLGFWERRNELEPFYLAAELRRAGANVVLLLTGAEDVQRFGRDNGLILRAVPHPNCCPWTTDAEPKSNDGDTSLLVTAGLRGLPRIREYCPKALMVESTFAAATGPFDVGLLPPHVARPRSWAWRFERQCSIGLGSIELHRAAALPSNLATELVWAVRDVTESAFRRACDIVERCDVQDLHICDHAFFESAILAEATRRHGGRVTVWPHSSNAVHVETRQSEGLGGVTCITRSAAETWLRHRPDLDCVIDSSLMLRPSAGARCFVPEAPLTIVVIAGAHSLIRMPLMDHVGHRATYRSLFAAFAALNSDVKVVFKPKGHWESAAWLQEIIGDVSFVTFTDRHPIEIEAPNMIFLTVSYASTALLEGLGRGVPCMVAREIDVEDYVTIDPSAIPIADAATISSRIAACRDPLAFSALVERQLAWYATETRFPLQHMHTQTRHARL